MKNLKEVALLFLKLGVIGFGGPAVHIAMMEEEVVRKRAWMTHEHFLDIIGAVNLIPGPNSTEMTMHIGHERAGWKGLVVAGLCFILPAVIITAVFAWAYQQYGRLPAVQPFFYGIRPAIIAVIVSLMITLGKKAAKTITLAAFGIIAAALALLGVNEVYILFGLGLAGMFLFAAKQRRQYLNSVSLFVLLQAPLFGLANSRLFWTFLKIGSTLYGSGYVLFAFLDTAFVKNGMLTKQQLADAIAVGQFTPGPVFSSATFVGWQILGLPGALAATVGIFLPSFVFVAFLHPIIRMLRKSTLMSAFLDTVNVVSVGLIIAVCAEMGKTAINDWRSVLIAVAGFLVTMRFKKINTAFVIAGGGLAGYFLSLMP